MITLFGIGNCDTIRKTRRWLEKNGHDFEFHDYKKQGCSTELATTFLSHFNLDQVVNKRGTTWRNLPDSAKDSLDAGNAALLMNQNPSLIKRPILKIGEQWALGYDEKAWQSLIKQA